MGCGDVKGCFGLQGGTCVQEGSCSAMVTYAVKGQRYEFELWATDTPANAYVAVAFSDDDIMGDDSVSECTLVNGRVNAYMSYNEGKSNTRLRDVYYCFQIENSLRATIMAWFLLPLFFIYLFIYLLIFLFILIGN